MGRLAKYLVAVMIGLVGFASPAWAVFFLDFDMAAPTTGSISYAGGTAPLVGTDISVDTVVGQNGTPLNDGVTLKLFDAVLNFETGDLTGSDSNEWFFGDGGSITLVGGVDLNGNLFEDAGDVPSGTTLLTGSFSGTESVEQFLFNIPPLGEIDLGFRILGAAFVDTKDQDLAAFYGLGNFTQWSGGINLSFFASTVSPPSGFSSTTLGSGDIVNVPVGTSIPEPSSMLLIGLGLLGAGVRGSRKLWA